MLTQAQIVLLLISVFSTSVLSGVFGMAGGLILMGVLATLLPVPLAMTAHGFAQLIANGTRFLSLRKHVAWRPTGYYVFGALLSASLMWFVSFTPSQPLLFIALGALPFVTFLKSVPELDYEKPQHAMLCGFLVTIAHLVAGVSGPVLDLFFVRSKLNRFETIGTKAFTQSLGHAMKIGYFGSLAMEFSSLPFWIPASVALCAIFGTKVGGEILKKMSEADFRLYLRRIFVLVGTSYLLRGIWELV